MMQPPLHRHVPVTHAVPDLHAEVGVVAVDVLDSFEVVFLFSVGVRTTDEEEKKTHQHKPTNSHSVKMTYIHTPVVDSRSSSRFGKCLFCIAAQTCGDASGLSSTPCSKETHPEHKKDGNHVEHPADGEKKTELLTHPFTGINNTLNIYSL